MIEQIEFLHPELLWLLLPLALSTIVLLFKAQKYDPSDIAIAAKSRQQRYRHTLTKLLPHTATPSGRSSISILVYIIVFLLLILALCDPVRIGSKMPDPPRERDIVFIIDTSISMTLQDYVFEDRRVKRITVLKAVIDRFVQKLEGERIAVIVFGDHAYTLVPMTSDQSLLRRMIARIEATMAGRFNAIGEGITLALKQAQINPARRQVLVLVTDADQPTGGIDPTHAAKFVAQSNLPLYTIAVGATGNTGEAKTHGGLIYEPVDITFLKSLSKITGARTYMAADSASLENAIIDIAQAETYARNVEPRFYRESFYYWPLLCGLVLLSCLQLSQLLRNNKL